MKLTVNLGQRSYPVHIGHDCYEDLPQKLSDLLGERRYALVTNTTIARIHSAHISHWKGKLDITEIVIPDGETYKSIETWSKILDKLLDAHLDRSAVLIAFGGGVVGDLTGFAAASFLRGVDYIQIPTTLLAMVDSSVGGKTGVNHAIGKNLIGAFHQPRMVWVDTQYLDSLPEREFISGYGEIFKYAFIGGRDMFDFVNSTHDDFIKRTEASVIEAISRSIQIKASIVEQDERESESGKRALLNFGHTFAHSLEHYYGYKNILHGEAVFWGIACACELGKRIGTIPQKIRPEYDEILNKLIYPQLPGKPETGALVRGMQSDKKARKGKIRFILPAKPGMSVVQDGITNQQVMGVLASVLNKNWPLS
jgi:3-dehydroquinate synthase